MSELNVEKVKKIAKLANLDLTENEAETFSQQLSEVIDYNIEKLNAVDTSSVKPLLNVSGLTTVVAEDLPEPSLTQEQVLQNTKAKHNGFFKVPQILEQE